MLCCACSLFAVIAHGAAAQSLGGSTPDTVKSDQLRRLAFQLRTQWAARYAAGETPVSVVEPSISSGTILTPTIDVTKAPGAPAVELTLHAGTVGAQYVTLGIESPTGMHSYQNSGGIQISAYPREPAKQTLKLQLGYPFGSGGSSLYTAPGAWQLYTLMIYSNDGTVITYTGQALAALFPSLVVNVQNSGTPDTTPPSIGKGTILTPSVSASSTSPYFAFRLPVHDNLSGVSYVNANVVNEAGNSGFATQSNIGLPVVSTNVVSYAMLPADTAPGTYTITNVFACDAAANCNVLNTPAEIEAALGATSFQVTQ